jgi:hypothetical protein
MANGNRRSNYHCSVATTTRNFAAVNEAGITRIYSAHPDKTHAIPAYGRLTFWSCASPTDATPAGEVTQVICPGNHLSTLNVSTLAHLQHLDCSYNDLEMLDLSGLSALRTLIVLENRLFTLCTARLYRLLTLDCYGNQLTSLDLTANPNLEVLDCSANRLLSLKLGRSKNLHTLYAYGNQFHRLDLAALPALRNYDLGNGHSSDAAFVPDASLVCNDGPVVLVAPEQAPDLADTTSNTRSVAKYYSPRARPLTPEEAAVRATAYALKQTTPEAITIAAPAMAALITGPCWLVPVPASRGNLVPNLTLARAIAQLVPGARVKCAVARVHPVESSCKRRLRGLLGLVAADQAMVRIAGPMEPLPLYFVDNVITTGATITACRRTLGWGTGLTYADASTRRNTFPFQPQPTNYENTNQTRFVNEPAIHKIRHGAISASIWRQETEKGPMFNVSIQRTYKDGDEWKSSTSFGMQNLLVVSLIATRAFEWISDQANGPEQP